MADLLQSIQTPHDLRRLNPKDLPLLASELRAFLLQTVSQTGGHLSASLGTVELCIALHYAFQTPQDKLVWDVGHQAYAHKILTGRQQSMHSLRQQGGLSGFPKRDESEYDAFGTAHAATSLSAVLGMAVAARQKGIDRQHIAVMGDGALTAGMAFEAINNACIEQNLRVLLVLNDNGMSISPAVGGLSRYLADVVQSSKSGAQDNKGQQAIQLVQLRKLGVHYSGPVDGHDINALLKAFERIKQSQKHKHQGLHVLHVITQKGRGYAPAEADPVAYHGVKPFDLAAGMQSRPQSQAAQPTFSQVFGQWLCDMAAQDERLIGITPAMCEGSGMAEFRKRFPSRYFDVGIAEQHAVTFAAGLACNGFKPVVAIYSTFLQRAYDQMLHDVALQNLPVVFALDRAGLVGADGATHAGNYDIAFTRCIPNMAIACPADEAECRQLLSTAYAQNSPVTVRYPRGSGVGRQAPASLQALPFGKGEIRRAVAQQSEKQKGCTDKPPQIAIVVFGTLLYAALEAAEKINAAVANMRWVKPLDEALLLYLAEKHDAFVTVEDGCIMGGAGSAVMECLQTHGIAKPVLQLGLPDAFIEHGDVATLMQQQGLDAQGIERSIRAKFL